jgi:phospholipid N-methyltransferase
MTDYAAIAARNMASRQAQLARLRPRYVEAKEKASVLRKAQEGAGTVRQSIELMATLKHVPGFFPTPRALVERMIAEAAIDSGMAILEPSAGKGDIARAVLSLGASVLCIEKNFTLAEHLRKQGFDTRCSDFLEVAPKPIYDRALMNPPFERHEDEKHIRHAFNFLAAGGRLVAIACSTSGSRLESWIVDLGGTVEPLPQGSFATSERPTQVNTCLISVDK